MSKSQLIDKQKASIERMRRARFVEWLGLTLLAPGIIAICYLFTVPPPRSTPGGPSAGIELLPFIVFYGPVGLIGVVLAVVGWVWLAGERAMLRRKAMCQAGELVFYSKSEVDNVHVLSPLLAWAAVTEISTACRSKEREHGWLDFVRMRDSNAPETDNTMVSVGNRIPVAQVVNLYEPDRYLVLEVGVSRIGTRVSRAVTRGIPESIRGSFLPTDLFLGIGGHDLFEGAEHEEGHLIDRSFLSVSFFGYGIPNDWNRFRELVFDLPEIAQTKREIEEILVPLEQVVYWSI